MRFYIGHNAILYLAMIDCIDIDSACPAPQCDCNGVLTLLSTNSYEVVVISTESSESIPIATTAKFQKARRSFQKERQRR